ncbi:MULTISPECIES: phasin family protein [unclassified Duganella]|uniref:phasin family protein n=1 Tax=unclassified Duganella TaxID=2636909 RepID=UPI0013EEBBA5|nr:MULTISPECIES: phasin family protein [unclassified Duganella]
MSLRLLDAMRKLSEINLQLGRDLIAEAGANTQRLMASKDATQLSAAIAAQLAPGRQSLQTYQHRVAEQLAQFQPGSQLPH